MKNIVSNPRSAACILSLFLAVSNFAQTVEKSVQWTPPTPRLKASRVFSPKPIAGHNIFKGEADKWLADAILKLEVEKLDVIENKAITDYVNQVGRNLGLYSKGPKKEFEFIVLEDEDADAFNLGGGRIYITLGMLREVANEDELAGVLAHEIGHDVFQHAAKAVTRQMFWLTGTPKINSAADAEKALEALNEKLHNTPIAVASEVMLGFARFAELEADRAAFYNLHKAGYNPRFFR
ncbi:MAG: M48 family metalloprotease, partial [Pyrinomonadaceae bacterium]